MTINGALTANKGITPSHTVGPFFHYGLANDGTYTTRNLVISNLVTDKTIGEKITLKGRLLDANGAPVNDAMIEIWQADASGNYNARNSDFKGIGRAATNEQGEFVFHTIKPASNNGQAPHFNVSILARGVLRNLTTRFYFAGEPLNKTDKILALVPKERHETMMLQVKNGVAVKDIHLQGALETVFFEIE